MYKVRHLELDEVRALKLQPMRDFGDEDDLRRLRREGRALAKLRHEHIVIVYDLGSAEDALYLEMEYVPGGNLADLLGRRGARNVILDVAQDDPRWGAAR